MCPSSNFCDYYWHLICKSFIVMPFLFLFYHCVLCTYFGQNNELCSLGNRKIWNTWSSLPKEAVPLCGVCWGWHQNMWHLLRLCTFGLATWSPRGLVFLFGAMGVICRSQSYYMDIYIFLMWKFLQTINHHIKILNVPEKLRKGEKVLCTHKVLYFLVL